MADYWAYRSFKADLLPSVNLQATPLAYSNASQLRYNSENQSDEFIRTENLHSALNLNVSQKVAATGGTFFVQSELGRIENYGINDYTQYSSRPFRIGYQQDLFGFNAMKWQRKIEPLLFEKAKQEYLLSTENMHITTINYFFGLVSAYIQMEMAQTNIKNTENLLEVAHRRFELGTVSREELLDLRLSNNNAQINLQQAGLNFREAKENLLNFLMLPVDTELETVIPENTPVTEVDVQLVLEKAIDNNPEILQLEQNILESQRNVEQANKARHFQAGVDVSYGISKDDGNYLESGQLKDVYSPEFEDYQQLSLGINIPILDWGRKKGQYEMAKSRHEIVQVAGRQSLQQFKQNAVTRAIAFNIQKSRVESAALSDTLANESYELTMTRFSAGQADVLRLTSSQNAKDNARLQYINALANYWNYYFILRQLTLFDFESNNNIEFDEDKVLGL
ncbi:TolC family protein [Geofilum rubicundum]|uniref:Outer membrane protein TolC n=1 Tax=Geofilum rubicundum JCM 15548 TaxID=1236989 RepID=A0A0E9M2N1_9BACT|nr:TolC family protein [Geofilum rubicundum]GAO31365.1 outer membrane protein TolC [Geofilum rubicundum JCM 15548]